MLRSVLTLLMGSGAAQLGPLLLGPVLSRLYGPEVFGVFHLATALAANVAVVACARYEFALPLAADEHEARQLRRLCVRVLAGVVLACAVVATASAWWIGASWPLVVPPTVAVLAALSLWTLEATRRQRFAALAGSRVLQFWGCGLLQAGLGWWTAGVWGLLLGPVLAAGAAALWLWWAARGKANTPPSPQGADSLRAIAQRHRDFPLFNTPHAFLGALQDTLSVALIATWAGPAAAGVWGLSLRFLKAPATLAGGALSQVLYPRLGRHAGPTPQALAEVRRVIALLLALALPLGLLVAFMGPMVMPLLLGQGWEDAGPLSRALAVYIAIHFVVSPLGVVTLAWKAQRWALAVSLAGQALFVAALALGLAWAPGVGVAPALQGAAWAISGAMAAFYGFYLWRLWHWPTAADAKVTIGT